MTGLAPSTGRTGGGTGALVAAGGATGGGVNDGGATGICATGICATGTVADRVGGAETGGAVPLRSSAESRSSMDFSRAMMSALLGSAMQIPPATGAHLSGAEWLNHSTGTWRHALTSTSAEIGHPARLPPPGEHHGKVKSVDDAVPVEVGCS